MQNLIVFHNTGSTPERLTISNLVKLFCGPNELRVKCYAAIFGVTFFEIYKVTDRFDVSLCVF